MMSACPLHNEGRQNGTRSFRAVHWTPLQVYKPHRGDELIVSVPEGNVFSGQLLGIMGPSGCGKTTLLEILAGSQNGLRSSGTVNVITKSQDKFQSEKIQREQVGFVHQDDNLFAMLSVRETLTLSANLKAINAGNHSSSKNVHSAVAETLQILGLAGVADSMVGVGGINSNVKERRKDTLSAKANDTSINRQKGSGLGATRISGGERKRLAIGSEVISTGQADTSRVHLLVVDEPTSGLDSYQALRVIRVLKELSQSRGLAVVCTIHQPRTSIFELLDDLLLLTPLGKPAYYGPRAEALDYFSKLGFECPPFTNPAEFLIDLVSLDYDNTASRISSEERIQTLVEKFESNIRPPSPEADVTSIAATDIVKDVPSIKWRPFSFSPARAIDRAVRRFGLLLQRAMRQVMRDDAVNISRVSVFVILAFLIGKVFGSPAEGGFSQKSVSKRVNVIANAAINVAMLSMIKTLQIVKREKVVVDRERAQGLYSASEYLLSKVVAELPFDSLAAAIFGVVLHYGANMRGRLDRFLYLLGMVSAACSSLGLALGALFPSDVALAVGPALMVIYIVLGSVGPAGSTDEGLPAILKPVKRLSPMKWACQALLAEEFQGQNFDETNLLISTIDPLSKFFRLLKGGAHVLSKCLHSFIGRRSKTDAQTKISFEAESQLKDGDRVLTALGIPNANFSASSKALVALFAGHVLLALAGLVITRPSG